MQTSDRSNPTFFDSCTSHFFWFFSIVNVVHGGMRTSRLGQSHALLQDVHFQLFCDRRSVDVFFIVFIPSAPIFATAHLTSHTQSEISGFLSSSTPRWRHVALVYRSGQWSMACSCNFLEPPICCFLPERYLLQFALNSRCILLQHRNSGMHQENVCRRKAIVNCNRIFMHIAVKLEKLLQYACTSVSNKSSRQIRQFMFTNVRAS